jgi:hypothetical protein
MPPAPPVTIATLFIYVFSPDEGRPLKKAAQNLYFSWPSHGADIRNPAGPIQSSRFASFSSEKEALSSLPKATPPPARARPAALC